MNQSLRFQQKIARAWIGIVERCYNPNESSYYWYGARGIEMCKRWQQSVDAFIQDMGMPPTLNHSVDRINNDGNYEPSNCRWATTEEQNNNTRRTKLITYNGKTQSLRDWAKEYDLEPRGLSDRLRRGWGIEKSLTTPGRVSFDQSQAEKKAKTDAIWKVKGKLYQAHSKQKRGQKLSKAEKEIIEAERERVKANANLEAWTDNKIQKESEDLATEIENASMFNPTIADLHNAGIASLRISEHLKVPVGVVDLIIDRHNNYSAPLTNSRRKILPSEIYEVLNMRKNGKTIRYIAKFTGIPKSTVHLIVSKNLQTQPAL